MVAMVDTVFSLSTTTIGIEVIRSIANFALLIWQNTERGGGKNSLDVIQVWPLGARQKTGASRNNVQSPSALGYVLSILPDNWNQTS